MLSSVSKNDKIYNKKASTFVKASPRAEFSFPFKN